MRRYTVLKKKNEKVLGEPGDCFLNSICKPKGNDERR